MRARLVLAVAIFTACAIAAGVGSRALAEESVDLASARSGRSAAGVDLVAPGPTLEERVDEIRRRVQSRTRYPKLARERGVEGRVLIAFGIDATTGAPRDPRASQSSGSLALDRAALEAVRSAAPYPWVYGRVEVPIEFVLAPRDADVSAPPPARP